MALKLKKVQYRSVAALVKAKLGTNINYPYEKLTQEVLKLCPESKWDMRQYSWYRSAIRSGRLKGMTNG